MQEVMYDSLAELGAIILSAIGSGVLTLAGVLTEQAGIQSIIAGEFMFGLWELWMGSLAVVAGIYLLGYQNVWCRLQEDSRQTP